MRKLLSRVTVERILSYGLAVVALWFGVNEMVQPENFTGYTPAFLGQGNHITLLIVTHGVLLTLAGLLLVAGYMVRLAAIVLALMLAELIISLILADIATDIIIRDIGLFAMTLALSLKPRS